MNREEAKAEAHALAKKRRQPAAIFQRRLPGGTLVNDFSIQTLYEEQPAAPYVHVMTVSTTGLERKHGPWADPPAAKEGA